MMGRFEGMNGASCVRMALAAAISFLPDAVFAGQARCWIDHGALVAPAAFGDIAGDFLIDLAAPVSQLHLTRAQEDGVEAPAPGVSGGDDKVETRRLKIAGETMGDMPLRVADLDGRLGAFDASLNGVIGADVLSRFIVEFDPAPCRLRLTRRGGPPAARGVRIPVRMLAGRPVVKALITDGDRARVGLFALGSGDGATTLWRARPTRTGGGGAMRLRALELGGRLFEQAPVRLGEGPDGGLDGVIGMSVLAHSRFRLDVGGGWLELGPPQGR